MRSRSKRVCSAFGTGHHAYLCTDGWAGRNEQAVLVVGETPKKYRIKAVMRTRMPGRCRWLSAGELALVPKHAIRMSA